MRRGRAERNPRFDLDLGGDGEGDDGGSSCCQCRRCRYFFASFTPSTERDVLKFAAVSSGVFATSQFVASVLSGSMSLLGDSVLMLVDVVTYIGNYAAISYGARVERSAAIFSIVALAVTTLYIAIESGMRLSGEEDASVNAPTMIAFSGANLLVDFVMMLFFFLHYREKANDEEERQQQGVRGGRGGRREAPSLEMGSSSSRRVSRGESDVLDRGRFGGGGTGTGSGRGRKGSLLEEYEGEEERSINLLLRDNEEGTATATAAAAAAAVEDGYQPTAKHSGYDVRPLLMATATMKGKTKGKGEENEKEEEEDFPKEREGGRTVETKIVVPKRTGKRRGAERGLRGGRVENSNTRFANHASEPGTDSDPHASTSPLNFLSAFMHQGADTLRSLTTLVGGGIVMILHVDSEKTDAVCGIIISFTILGGMVLLVWQVCEQDRKEREEGEEGRRRRMEAEDGSRSALISKEEGEKNSFPLRCHSPPPSSSRSLEVGEEDEGESVGLVVDEGIRL